MAFENIEFEKIIGSSQSETPDSGSDARQKLDRNFEKANTAFSVLDRESTNKANKQDIVILENLTSLLGSNFSIVDLLGYIGLQFDANGLNAIKNNPSYNNYIQANTIPSFDTKVEGYVYVVYDAFGYIAAYMKEDGTQASIFDNSVADNGISASGLSDINFKPLMGQSLSRGSEAIPIISSANKYPQTSMFNTGVLKAQGNVSDFTSFYPIVENTQETPCSGMAEMIIELLQKDNLIYNDNPVYDNKKFLFGSHGTGGATITMLYDSYFQGLKNAVQGGKNIADGIGKTFSVPLWHWIQGESDLRGFEPTAIQDKAAYKAMLLQFHNEFNEYAKGVTGQLNDLKCVLYQTGNISLYSQDFSFSFPYTGIPMAQLELLIENDNFIPSCPIYILDTVRGNNIHLTNFSSKLLGAYHGFAFKKSIIDKAKVKPVYPKLINISGNDIVIQFHAPVLPLVFDTSYVREAANMGFNVVKSDNSELITSVSVLKDTVTIKCSESPLNAKLRYAVNGETVNYSTVDYVTGASGRIDGARGNLRDSQGLYNTKNIDGVEYPLHNYAYAFDILLNQNQIINLNL